MQRGALVLIVALMAGCQEMREREERQQREVEEAAYERARQQELMNRGGFNPSQTLTPCPGGSAKLAGYERPRFSSEKDPYELQMKLIAAIQSTHVVATFEDGDWLLIEVSPQLLLLAIEYQMARTKASQTALSQQWELATKRILRPGARTFFAMAQQHKNWGRSPTVIVMQNQVGDTGFWTEMTPGLKNTIVKRERGFIIINDVVRECDASYTVSFFTREDGHGAWRASFTFEAGGVAAALATAAGPRLDDIVRARGTRMRSSVFGTFDWRTALDIGLTILSLALK